MRNPILHTARCTLRCVDIADEEHVWTASRVPGFTDGMMWNPPETHEEMRPFTEKAIENWKNDVYYNWTIEDSADHRFIGRIEIRPLQNQPDIWEMGFWTHPREWGKGYMTEVAEEVIKFGFEVLHAQKIVSGHSPWNLPSKKVHEKVGFKYVGLDTTSLKKNGKPFPEEKYEITKGMRNL